MRRRPYIPLGVDQQGRHPDRAEPNIDPRLLRQPMTGRDLWHLVAFVLTPWAVIVAGFVALIVWG